MPLIKTNRLQMYYEEAGSGEPLLIIRGLGSSCETMGPLSKLLSEQFRVISFDNRCVGRTDQPQEPFSVGDMADDTAALLDQLGIESTHVFGMSLGGMIAQELMFRHPRLVARVALGCTHSGAADAVRVAEWARQNFADSAKMPRPDALKHSIPILFSTHTVEQKPDLVREILSVMEKNNQDRSSYGLQLKAALGFNAWDRLRELRFPILILTGTEDNLIASENSRLMAQRIPGARLVEFPQTGHLFFSEDPENVSRTLIEFLTAS